MQVTRVWLNGSLVEGETAQVSVFDAGFQHGVGLFETMLARNGRVFRPQAHMARLAESARELSLTDRLRVDQLSMLR
jgi:branched-chain amino acid aminotransferase